ATYQNYACEISLPIYPQLTEVELEYICKTVIEAVKKITK
ncbi:MAG: dTDP-4-amino-4,6-dideoxygalactose transaminase, partial [Bacteroidia bacterium]